SWKEASEFCQSLGAQLATIRSEEENQFLQSLLPPSMSLWIGLHNKENQWSWVDGNPFEYHAFSGQPKPSDGAAIWYSGRWSIAPSNLKQIFAVEWKLDGS